MFDIYNENDIENFLSEQNIILIKKEENSLNDFNKKVPLLIDGIEKSCELNISNINFELYVQEEEYDIYDPTSEKIYYRILYQDYSMEWVEYLTKVHPDKTYKILDEINYKINEIRETSNIKINELKEQILRTRSYSEEITEDLDKLINNMDFENEKIK